MGPSRPSPDTRGVPVSEQACNGVDGVAHPVLPTPSQNGGESALIEDKSTLLPRSSSGEIWVVELKPTTDPLGRRGLPSRPVAVRMRFALKELLRVHGF